MGNTNNNQVVNEQKQSEFIFVQTIKDKFMDEVEIYRSKTGIYIMKTDRTSIFDTQQQQQGKKIVQFALRQETENIIPIVHLITKQQIGVCGMYEKSVIYTEYYNYSLDDLLQTKKELEQSQLWYILQSLLHLIIILQKQKIVFSLSLERIYLTLSGVPCVYHYDLKSNSNSVSFSFYSMAQNLGRILLQLGLNQKLQQYFEEDDQNLRNYVSKLKSKYHHLGVIIGQLIYQEKLEQQILQQISEYQLKGTISIASQIKLLKFKFHIPDNTHIPNDPNNDKLMKKESSKIINPLKNKDKKRMVTQSSQKFDPLQSIEQNRKSVMTQQSNQKNIQQSISKKRQIKSEVSTIKKVKQTSVSDTAKILSEFQRKKIEYNLQLQKFLIRKEQLLTTKDKENINNIPKYKKVQNRSINKNQPSKKIMQHKQSRYR